MIDSVISSLKGELSSKLTSQFGLSSDKVEPSVNLAKDNVKEGLLSEAKKGNFSDIKNLLSGNQAQSSGIVNNITNNYIGDLTSKLGIPSSMASSVGNFVIPFIMQKLGQTTQGQNLDQASIMSMLGGGDALKNLGGLGGKLGGMFGN
jgi:hypothetical protein